MITAHPPRSAPYSYVALRPLIRPAWNAWLGREDSNLRMANQNPL